MAKSIFLSPSNQCLNIGAGNYTSEAEYMNALANLIEFDIERCGVTAEREGNEISVKERIKMANQLNINAYISLHSNIKDKKSEGCEIYIPKNSDSSLKLSESVYSYLCKIDGFIWNGIKKSERLAEVVLPKAPCCLIELDYHDNPVRSQWMINNIRQIAHAITIGILNFLDEKYKPKDIKKYYRIEVGKFTCKESAQKFCEYLNQCGFPGVIRYY